MIDFNFSPIGIVCENTIPVEEANSATISSFKVMTGKKIKAVHALSKSGDKLSKLGQNKEAIDSYKKAKNILISLKKDASKIPDESWKDFALMLVPIYGLSVAGKYLGNKIIHGKGKNSTRKDAVEDLSTMIYAIDEKIKECREDMSKK